jgi:large subunit ribosomal protein L30
MAATIRVTYRKSAIGYSQRQKDTIRSLGLKHLGHMVELPDNAAIRGMVHHVRHLVETETVEVDDADRTTAEQEGAPSGEKGAPSAATPERASAASAVAPAENEG